MCALIEVGAFYVAKGYGEVFLSDFDVDHMHIVEALLRAREHRVIRLHINDDGELTRRVLTETRSSAFRDCALALRINRETRERRFPREVAIDVTGKPVAVIAAELMAILEM